uniref:Calcium regulated heat stable protein 1 n=1 Tax=Taeniopygia guttata TaxID=59729 RepID=A0A674GT73_TAEGU
MLSRNPFFLSELLREVLSPCNSPELCLSKQRITQQERGEAGESCSSGPPPALLPAVRCSLLAQPSSTGSREGSQPCLHPGKELPCCRPPHTRDRGARLASGMSSEPGSSSSQACPGCAPPPGSLQVPEARRPRERSPSPLRGYLIPSPLPTRRTRTFSATVRASEGPIYKGVCKCFCRSKGHGFITPADGGPDIFVHISDIEGEYVPVAGDEVTYKMCTIPPKNEKLQAVEVVITHLAPGTKHETWSGHVISS